MADQPRFCESCGSPLNPGAAFCPQCGHALYQGEDDFTQPFPVIPVNLDESTVNPAEAKSNLAEAKAEAEGPTKGIPAIPQQALDAEAASFEETRQLPLDTYGDETRQMPAGGYPEETRAFRSTRPTVEGDDFDPDDGRVAGLDRTTQLPVIPQSRAYQSSLEPQRKKKGSGAAIAIGIIVGLLVAGLGIAAFVFLNQSKPETVVVPEVAGMTQDEAAKTLEGNGLSLGVVSTQPNATYDKDLVVSSNPTAGAKAPKDSKVDLVVSSGKKAETGTTDDAEQGTEDDDEGDKDESTVSEHDKQLYSQLSNVYERLGSYDTKISQQAANFNSHYTDESMATREKYAREAQGLLDNLSASMEDFDTIDISADDRYFDNYLDMSTCYTDLYNRLWVLTAAWDISLSYDNPAGHDDEITAPILEDSNEGGNKYKQDFEKRYPNCKPEDPSKN